MYQGHGWMIRLAEQKLLLAATHPDSLQFSAEVHDPVLQASQLGRRLLLLVCEGVGLGVAAPVHRPARRHVFLIHVVRRIPTHPPGHAPADCSIHLGLCNLGVSLFPVLLGLQTA